MNLLKNSVLAMIGFASGTVISGGVFAFISIIGIVPRMAQRTKTENKIKFYEDAITLGGLFGTLTLFVDFYIPIGSAAVIFLCFCIGIFVGCLAVSLAEVLNVIPIFMRRVRLQKGIVLFVFILAFGKFIGSLMYFIIPGFYQGF